LAAAGSLPKEARRCWYVAKPIFDSLQNGSQDTNCHLS